MSRLPRKLRKLEIFIRDELIGGVLALYIKERNLYVLGIFHGWFGGLFYYTVVDRDPFLEMFGKLLNLKT